MRIWAFVIGALVIGGLAVRGLTTPNEHIYALPHVGQRSTIEGTVSDVFIDRKSNTTFIDIGSHYPDSAFSGVIFSEYARTFPNVASLKGKRVAIKGFVQLYRGKPEVVLKTADQIEIR